MSLTDDKQKIFVYGTLRGTQLGNLIHHNDSIVGLVVSLGHYPALVSLNTDLRVEGDVFDVTDDVLDKLDKYEGVDTGLYSRATTITEAGHTVIVYMYNQIVKSWRPSDDGYYDISYHDLVDVNRFG